MTTRIGALNFHNRKSSMPHPSRPVPSAAVHSPRQPVSANTRTCHAVPSTRCAAYTSISTSTSNSTHNLGAQCSSTTGSRVRSAPRGVVRGWRSMAEPRVRDHSAAAATQESGSMSHTADDDTGSMSLPAGDGSASGSSGGDSNIAVILVEPKRGENIGAAARAMKNFGLRDMRLVRPAGGEWPNERARAVSARAIDVLDGAKVYDTLDEALSDLQYVYATSGRPRAQDKLAKDVVMLRQVQDKLPPADVKVGIMFGREDNGLYNEELVRANAILTIDTDPGFYSLNLGQAVLIVCYELFRAPRRPGLGAKREVASRREVESMLSRLFGALEARSFFNQYNREVLQFAIRGFFDRVDRLSRQDVAAVGQVLKALQKAPKGTGTPQAPEQPSSSKTEEHVDGRT